MTDEQRPADTASESGTTTTAPQGEAAPAAEGVCPEHGPECPGHDQQEGPEKLTQTVEIRDVGPCKKHIKVSVDRKHIEKCLNDKFKELVKGEHAAAIPGFRPGKAPRKLIERRFRSDVSEKVKAEVLLASLEQLAEEHDLAPLAPPDIDPSRIVLPKEGPFTYEFEVEVRPEFDLPVYKGLRLKRPVKTFTDEDVRREMLRLLAPHSQIVPKPEGNAQIGDILIADVTVRDGDRVINTLTEYAVRIDTRLAFKDGVAERFGEQVQGANPGDTRSVDIVLSRAVADESLRGKTVQAVFAVKDVKTLRPPELTHEFLHHFGVHTEEQFRELIRVLLQRRLAHQQRQFARQQIIQQLGQAQWQLPNDLLVRQARRALARRVMEMRADGIPDEEIRARQRLLEQDILTATAISLKEHFILQKIAELEKIEIDDDDIDLEIERLADQLHESPRRLRSRLEKEDQLEALAAEIVERKALDVILDNAEWEDVPLEPQEQAPVATVEVQTVPGPMQDLTAAPPPVTEPAPEAPPQS